MVAEGSRVATMNRFPSARTLLTLSAATGAFMLALVGPMDAAQAQVASGAVADLVRQGDFWRSRGRGDLAAQAYNRALQLDPSNAAARRGLSGPAPAPAAAPNSAPAAAASTPAAPTGGDRPAAPRATAARPSAAAPQRANVSASDRAGRARVAGFAALDRGELASAASQFEQALAINSNDPDALGGLGVTRLRQERFKDARDLLERASRGAGSSRWAEALASARFFAGIEDAQAASDSRQAEAILTGLLTGSAAPDQKALAAVQLGDLLMLQGRYAEAKDAYAQAQGQNAEVGYKIANAEAAQAAADGDPVRAENAYRQALELGGGNDPWLRYAFAGFLLERGRASDAAAIIQPLEASTSSEALYAAALYYSQAERPADAQRLLRRVPEAARTADMRALESEIGLADAERQARLLASAGRGAEAMALLDRYNVAGASAGQQIRLGGAYYAIGARDRAAQLAAAAAAQSSGLGASQEPLVRLLAQTGQDELALGVIQRATGGSTTSATARRLYSTLAVASADRLREDGLRAEAFDVLQSGWSVAPQDPAILVSLGRLYQEGDMTQEAAQVFELALARKPGDADALTGLADTSAARGDYAKARQASRLLLRDRPQDVDAYLLAARVEQAAGDRRAARRYLEQAQQLGQPRGLPSGSAFTVANPFRSSLQNQTAAVAINPFAPETLRSVGRVSQGEPVLTPVQQALADLATEDSPTVDAAVEARIRSGEDGLSRLNGLTTTVRGSIPVGQGRIGLSIAPTVIDAGAPNRSASARFGRNATAEALAIVAQEPTLLATPDSQYAAGVALSAYFESPTVQADIGTTPLGFEKTDVQAGFSWRPRLGAHGALKVFAERRPVTDSVLSYAGATDPVSGESWGSVMKTGGGIGASWDQDGSGFYGDAAYRAYAGRGVSDNNAVEINMGAYRRLYGAEALNITAGVSLNYQSFDRNLSYFTQGHGGYFSPQSFVSMAFPIDARWKRGDWSINAQFSPGFQTYQQDAAALYPNDPAAQAQLVALKLLNNDVRAQYDSESRSGFAFTGGIEAWRQMGATAIGLDARMNTFGNYDEYRMTLRLKQAFGAVP